MMSLKERAFAPLVAVSLEALVPPDHFCRLLGPCESLRIHLCVSKSAQQTQSVG
jgi:hypothetical protein